MRKFIIAAIFAVVLSGCAAHGDDTTTGNAATPIPATSAQIASTKAVLAAPVADPYPNGMAETYSQCTLPGYNPNNGVCHPTGTFVPPAANPPHQAMTLDQINDKLSQIGQLDAEGLNDQGYPIMNVECEADGHCVNATGTPIGNVDDVAKQMLPVSTDDVMTYSYQCAQICKDTKGNIIGRL